MKIVLDSFINGTFNGWDGETLFKLGNNQYWIQSSYAYRYHYAYRPLAKIIEENGAYYLMVDGLNEKLQVNKVTDVVESQIENDFEGWSGETTFKLTNGQVWKQSNYSYHYHYAYRPNVIIYDSPSGYRLFVDGVTDTINVRRIS